MDINNGLPTNTIRVIKKDGQQRLWLGTDHGLVILNDKDSSFKSITEKFSEQQVYGLVFYKNYVLIGTHFNGIFIYDISNRQLISNFDSTEIGSFWSFKVLRDTVFFGTSKSAFYLLNRYDKWNLTRIKSVGLNGFFSGFALWQDHVFASLYSHGNQYIYQFQNDSLVRSPLIKPLEFGIDMLVSLSLTSNDSLMILGGSGFDLKITKNQDKKFEFLVTKSPNKPYPVWDAELIDSKIYLAIGNPDNSREGMIHEPGVTSLDDLNKSFYGQSLYYDKNKKGMWAGTFNAGLYYWPMVTHSYHIPKSAAGEFRYKPIDNKRGLLYNDDKVYMSNIVNHEFVEIFDRTKQKMNSASILDVDQWNDTTAVLIEDSLFLVYGKNKTLKSFACAQGNYMHKRGSLIYVFSIYNNMIILVDLKKNKSLLIPCPSNQVKATPYNNGNLIYSSNYTGFHYFDTSSHDFNIYFPLVEKFTIQSDTLWILNAGIIKSFKIDLKNYKLIPITESNIKDRISGIFPSWILQNNGKIYCGDNKGFLLIENKAGTPNSYTYIGNYSQGKTPVTDGEFMYFNQQNYITRINPENYRTEITASLVNITILPDKSVYQHSPLSIHFKSDDYLIQKHSLKEIEIFSKGKLIRTLFTIADNYELPSGLGKGDYVLRFKVNGVNVGEQSITIRIPLTANPLFYIAVTIFIVAFFGLLFKSILNKRSYDKRILENRLQLLKQNLNPHFIFNSLNLIYSLVLQRKNEAAINTINNFSDLHRYYLDNINKPKISIEEELKFIESYLKLEAERVEVDFPFVYHLPNNLDKQSRSVLVPPMILQPLVENAVKYCGADSVTSSDSCIWVDIHQSGGKLIIGVENTVGIDDSNRSHGSGSGLRLVNERIEIFNKTYKESVLLLVTDSLLHCKRGYRCELLVILN